MSPESSITGLSGKNAALLKGGEEARAYVVGRVQAHMEKNGLPPPPSNMVVVIRDETETLEQCIEMHGLSTGAFSFLYKSAYHVLERKSRGLPYRAIPPDRHDRRPARQVLDEFRFVLVRADQSGSEVPAITYMPEPHRSQRSIALVSREALLAKHKDRFAVMEKLKEEGYVLASPTANEPSAITRLPPFPPIALVSLNAVRQGMRRAALRGRVALSLPDGWRDDVIAEEEKQDKLRREVETAAVEAVAKYYLRRGCDAPKSRELDNVGWDLEFRKGGRALLRVEVKGTQAVQWSGVQVELTPNEVKQADNPRFRNSYRLAVVRDALRNPKCAIYERDGDGWRRVPDLGGDDDKAPAELTTEPSGSVIVRMRRR